MTDERLEKINKLKDDITELDKLDKNIRDALFEINGHRYYIKVGKINFWGNQNRPTEVELPDEVAELVRRQLSNWIQDKIQKLEIQFKDM